MGDSINTTAVYETTTVINPNPWYGIYGIQRIVEIVYLCTVIMIGTLGNMLVICSIKFAKRTHLNGNIFIVNLAFADLLVTAILVPCVLANVIATQNTLPDAACRTVAFLMSAACACSIHNLAAIAFNRYWAIVRPCSYPHLFGKRNSRIMVCALWLWTGIPFIPAILLAAQPYDYHIMECLWDDQFSLPYTISLVAGLMVMPFIVICVCYARIYHIVKKRSKWLMEQGVMEGNSSMTSVALNRDIKLLKTVAVIIAAYMLFWMPYGVTIIASKAYIPPLVKKIIGWMAFSNSAVNFIIYGAMNKSSRDGYRNFITYLLGCGPCKHTKSSTPNISVNTLNSPAMARKFTTQATLVKSKREKIAYNINSV
uniref:G-protein coupled receptors family 1 profile domain-containing protein n=1 Tax=Ciona savignyi TaxID=51511 RepID=H2YXT3_CIOSA